MLFHWGINLESGEFKMSQFFPALYSEGVFKPLRETNLPVGPKTYLLVALPSEEVANKLTPLIDEARPPWEQRILHLIAELKDDFSKANNVDFQFQFDEEHKQIFLENARSLAPLIPGMIPEETTTLGNNGNENVSI